MCWSLIVDTFLVRIFYKKGRNWNLYRKSKNWEEVFGIIQVIMTMRFTWVNRTSTFVRKMHGYKKSIFVKNPYLKNVKIIKINCLPRNEQSHLPIKLVRNIIINRVISCTVNKLKQSNHGIASSRFLFCRTSVNLKCLISVSSIPCSTIRWI